MKDLIVNCTTCIKYSQAKPKPKPAEQLGQEIPAVPWTKLASDIFHFQNSSYLLIVDYTSKFPVVKKLNRLDQQSVINKFEEVCSERGYPECLVSDNGLCYRGELFNAFMKQKGIVHITSSPHYPQSNGLAEALVKVVKNLFYKAQEEGMGMGMAIRTLGE